MRGYRAWMSVVVATVVIGCGNTGRASDAGPGDGGGRQAHVVATVSGARSASWDYTESHTLSGNYVSCVTDGYDFFSVQAYDYAGGSNGLTVGFHGYHGPDTYTFTYDTPGYTNLSADAEIGSYQYWYFYTYDPNLPSTSELASSCTIEVASSSTTTHATGSITCSAFPAQITSPDYMSPATTFQPTIAMSATFDCDL